MDPKKMMGFQLPGDEKVSITARDWDAMKRAIWRSKIGWEIVTREVTTLLSRFAHMEGCPAVSNEIGTCLPDCPDREFRLSALVILNVARQHGPTIVRKPAEGAYFAPSREHYSEMLAQFAAAQAELEAIKAQPAHTLPAPNDVTQALKEVP